MSKLDKAKSHLLDLANELHFNLTDVAWYGPDLQDGFGHDIYSDRRDAEAHLRDLWRLILHNELRASK